MTNSMDDSRYYKRTIRKEKVASSYLDEERSITIFLPPGYQDLVSYPVVYCQDGDDFFNYGRFATQAMKLILDEGVEPFIIIGVSVSTAQRRDEYSPDGSRFAKYCRFFTEELIPYVEEHYPVRSTPEQRILAGDSLGGAVSIHLALNYPDLFHQVVSLSGAFYPPTQKRIEAETDLSWLKLYMVIGLSEDQAETPLGTFDFLSMNRISFDLLQRRHAKTVYNEKDGKHIWGFWQKEIPAAMQHFLGTSHP